MKLFERFAAYLLRNASVDKCAVVAALDAMDADADGKITLGELVAALKLITL